MEMVWKLDSGSRQGRAGRSLSFTFCDGLGVGGAGRGRIKNQAADKEDILEGEIPHGIYVWRRVGDRRYWRL